MTKMMHKRRQEVEEDNKKKRENERFVFFFKLFSHNIKSITFNNLSTFFLL